MSLLVGNFRKYFVTAIFIAAYTGLFIWAYFPCLANLLNVWDADPNYSHGFMVPLLAIGVLFFRIHNSPFPTTQADYLGGFAALVLALCCRLVSAYAYISPLEYLSVLITMVSGVLLFGGRHWLACVWPAIALLVLTIPLPASLNGGEMTSALQTIATRISCFCLQTLGFVAYRDGNSIFLKSSEIRIVEACSGLKMLMVFLALAAFAIVVLPLGWIRKSILCLTAVPLAIGCNVIRIVAAGAAGESLGSESGHFVFHDLSGWLMIPLAFVLFGFEIFALGRLFQTIPEGKQFPTPPVLKATTKASSNTFTVLTP